MRNKNKLTRYWPYALIFITTSIFAIYLVNDSRYFFYDDFDAFHYVITRSYLEIFTDSLVAKTIGFHKSVGYLLTKLLYDLFEVKLHVYFFTLFVVHTLNSFLLYKLLHRITKKPIISTVISLVFAWRFYLWWFSNIHVKLTGLLFLLALHLWLNFLKNKRMRNILGIWVIFPIAVSTYGPSIFLPVTLIFTSMALKGWQATKPYIKYFIPLIVFGVLYTLSFASAPANTVRFDLPTHPYYRPVNLSTFIYTHSLFLHDLSSVIPQSITITKVFWGLAVLLTLIFRHRLFWFLAAFIVALSANSFFPNHTMFYYMYAPIIFILIYFAHLLQSKKFWPLFLVIFLLLFNPFHNFKEVAFRLRHPSTNFEHNAMRKIVAATQQAIDKGKLQVQLSNWEVTPNVHGAITYKTLPLFMDHPQENDFNYSYNRDTEILTLIPKNQ